MINFCPKYGASVEEDELEEYEYFDCYECNERVKK